MAESGPGADIATSLRRHLLVAGAVVVLLAGGLGAWAGLAKISSAVVANGVVVVESNVKRVQHREGGIVREIRARNGDLVAAGDLLLRLDDTVTRASLAIVSTQLDELRAQAARLVAERDDVADISFPEALMRRAGEPAIRAAISGQQALLKARRASLKGRKEQLREQIGQFEKQVEGLAVQRASKEQEIELNARELGDLETLFAKALIPASRIYALRRDRARLAGERGGFIAQIAQTREAISERRIQILQIEEDVRAEVLQQLQDTRSQIAQLTERENAARDELRRVDIRAPRSGYVHQLAVHTVGGVIGPGETAMLIVPREDLLIIEARIEPMDVDRLSRDQPVVVRFPNFNLQTTPELEARVLSVSADLEIDRTTSLSYYTARLALSDGEKEKLGGNVIVPGMPVEAFIVAGDRTVLSYLLKPLADQIRHAFREE